MTDFIIVGRGLAAFTLSHTFLEQGISFRIIGNDSLSTCSRVAAGIWNPIVFKRLTKSWLVDELIPCLNSFYSECEIRLNTKLLTQRPILKPYGEEQEKTFWLKKAKSDLSNFLEDNIYESISKELSACKIPRGYGRVLNSGNLDMVRFLDASTEFFKDKITDEIFDHTALQIQEDFVIYKNCQAKHIIFCEGFLVKNNPYFNWIPLKPAKGEVFTAAIPELHFSNTIFNKNGFLMDLSPGVFKAGATYAWDDLSQEPTEEAKRELTEKLRQMISCDFEIKKHEAGIRPSSGDRRPIIGTHPKYSRLHVFNGLGTKGVMLAPYFAKKFVNFCLQKEALHSEVNLTRFYHVYEKTGKN
jgi:hypothetical protein